MYGIMLSCHIRKEPDSEQRNEELTRFSGELQCLSSCIQRDVVIQFNYFDQLCSDYYFNKSFSKKKILPQFKQFLLSSTPIINMTEKSERKQCTKLYKKRTLIIKLLDQFALN